MIERLLFVQDDRRENNPVLFSITIIILAGCSCANAGIFKMKQILFKVFPRRAAVITDWKEYYKSPLHLSCPIYLLLQLDLTAWQVETLCCTLISFFISQAAGLSWLRSRGVHRSQTHFPTNPRLHAATFQFLKTELQTGGCIEDWFAAFLINYHS